MQEACGHFYTKTRAISPPSWKGNKIRVTTSSRGMFCILSIGVKFNLFKFTTDTHERVVHVRTDERKKENVDKTVGEKRGSD